MLAALEPNIAGAELCRAQPVPLFPTASLVLSHSPAKMHGLLFQKLKKIRREIEEDKKRKKKEKKPRDEDEPEKKEEMKN